MNNVETETPWASPRPSTGAVYFPTLDGLRFVAFVLVFIHHLPLEGSPLGGFLHGFGWVGVHVFFFLSAYLLSTILRQEYAKTGAIDFKRFFTRRALRIWPLYFVFCAFSVAFARVRLGWTEAFTGRVAGLSFFVDNVVTGVSGYNQLPFVAHLWTISVEEQFYLLLPFLLVGACFDISKLKRRLLLVWALFIVARVVSVAFSAPHPWIWTSLFSADALLLGTFMGAVGVRWGKPLLNVWMFVGGTALLFSSALLPDIRQPGLHQVIAYAFVSAGAAVWTLCALDARWLKWLGIGPFRYLGKISFGLYVFHFVGITVAARVAERVAGGWLLQFIVGLAATIAMASISYEVFERRFIALKQRFEIVRTRSE